MNQILCRRNISIRGEGMNERHEKSCVMKFESLAMRGGYRDIKQCSAEITVSVCKFCRQAPVSEVSPAICK